MCAANRTDAIDVAKALARQVFGKRGNHSETHLSESELAAMIALGIERAAEEAEERLSSALSHAEMALGRHRQHALTVLSFGDAKVKRLRAEADRTEEIVVRLAKLVEEDSDGDVDQTPAFRELQKQLRLCGDRR